MHKNLKFLTKIKVKFKKIYRKLNNFWEVFQINRKFKKIFKKLMKKLLENAQKLVRNYLTKIKRYFR